MSKKKRIPIKRIPVRADKLTRSAVEGLRTVESLKGTEIDPSNIVINNGIAYYYDESEIQKAMEQVTKHDAPNAQD